jgi:hypothetical protein
MTPIINRENLLSFIELADTAVIDGKEYLIEDTEEEGLYTCKAIYDNSRTVLDVEDLLKATIEDDQITMKLENGTEIMFLVKLPMQFVEPMFF